MVGVVEALIKTNAVLAAALLTGCLLSTEGTGDLPTQDVACADSPVEHRPVVASGSDAVATDTAGPLPAESVAEDGGVSEDAAVVYTHEQPSAESGAPPDSPPPEVASMEDAGVEDAGPVLEPINGLRACPEGGQCMSDGYCHDGGYIHTPSGSCQAEREYCYVGPHPENTIGRCVRTDQDWVICAYVCEPSRN